MILDLIRDYSLVFIFFVLPIIFVIQPLFLNKINNLENQIDIPSLERRKRLLYRQIKELEMEFDIGNVNQKDFEISRKELKVEVSEVITKLNDNKI
ncbi:MAG: hypothetical protein ACJZ1P_01835 [Candidatus Neomarinimicrobiota bacterium]